MELSITFGIVRNFGLTPCICCRRISQRRAIQKKALRQIYGYRTALFDRQTGLFSHKWDDEKQAFVRKDFRGVGNGWAAAGLARTIDLLPETMSSQGRQVKRA